MSRELQRKRQKQKKKDTQKLTLSTANTGLSALQLSQLQQLATTASTCFDAKDYVNTEKLCRLILKIYPKYVDAYQMLGGVALHYDKYQVAADYFEKVLEIAPNEYVTLSNYAIALKYLNRHEEALKSLNKSLRVKKDYFEALNNKGSILSVMGKMQDAFAFYEKAIKANPEYGKPYYNIATGHKFIKGDKFSKLFDEVEPCIDDLPVSDQMNLNFAFGKYYEDIENYDKGFKYYLKANQLKRSTLNYSIENLENSLTTIAKMLPVDGEWRHQTSIGNPSDVPVFILGMPRSGTTLVEQILASHPKVFGAGELKLANTAVGGLNVNTEGLFPEDPVQRRQLELDLTRRGDRFVEDIKAYSPGSAHVTDKMPQNFRCLGLLHLMMPNAKIIHCKRHPVDTCLSNFRILFGEQVDYTYSLEEIGRYYVGYSKLMDHWKKALPDRFLDVQYEDVVDDMETQARRILDHCDLEWDDACLSFHKTRRNVHTASTTQVRQPIYKGAVGRWERYGDLLAPLLKVLKPVM